MARQRTGVPVLLRRLTVWRGIAVLVSCAPLAVHTLRPATGPPAHGSFPSISSHLGNLRVGGGATAASSSWTSSRGAGRPLAFGGQAATGRLRAGPLSVATGPLDFFGLSGEEDSEDPDDPDAPAKELVTLGFVDIERAEDDESSLAKMLGLPPAAKEATERICLPGPWVTLLKDHVLRPRGSARYTTTSPGSKPEQFFSSEIAGGVEGQGKVDIVILEDLVATRAQRLWRRIGLLQRSAGLCSSGGLLAVHDVFTTGGRTHLLAEPTVDSLERMVQRRYESGLFGRPTMKDMLGGVPKGVEVWKPLGHVSVPLEESLPILVDILRGVLDLETAGVIHNALELSQIRLTPEGRAVVSGLGSACLEHNGEGWFLGPAGLKDPVEFGPYVGSPLLQAPEIVDGSPTGFSNHAWQVGLLFARLCFGYDPTMRTALRHYGHIGLMLTGKMTSHVGREEVRDVLRQDFVIGFDPSFRMLDQDLQKFLIGLLDRDPEQRLSTEAALEAVEKIARSREIELPAPREVPKLESFNEGFSAKPATAASLGALAAAFDEDFAQGGAFVLGGHAEKGAGIDVESLDDNDAWQ